MYNTDNNVYPETWYGAGYQKGLIRLTTPIAYLTSLPNDIFGNRRVYIGPNSQPMYIWNNRTGEAWYFYWGGQWGIIQSLGPMGPNYPGSPAEYWTISNLEYDPTNGIMSPGRIERFVPGGLKLEDTLPK